MSDARELLEQYAADWNHGVVYGTWEPAAPRAFDALRAVLDRHQPFNNDGVTYCGWDRIDGCGHVWPCPDVQAITRALAGDSNA